MKGIYLAGGYPDRPTFKKCAQAVARCGFDFIEIGIPFNDPIADGPVIARALYASISGGTTPEQVIEDIRDLDGLKIRKYAMTYANIVYSRGIRSFSEDLKGSLDGVIIPDLPNRMARMFCDQGLEVPIVPFATLETRQPDIELMNASKSGIIYFVGVRGITGSASNFSSPELAEKAALLKKHSSKKIIIGFGIKTAEDARQAMEIGDGFVVGTEAVRRQEDPEELEKYLRSLSGTLYA